jgi:hypothetical protein
MNETVPTRRAEDSQGRPLCQLLDQSRLPWLVRQTPQLTRTRQVYRLDRLLELCHQLHCAGNISVDLCHNTTVTLLTIRSAKGVLKA